MPAACAICGKIIESIPSLDFVDAASQFCLVRLNKFLLDSGQLDFAIERFAILTNLNIHAAFSAQVKVRWSVIPAAHVVLKSHSIA